MQTWTKLFVALAILFSWPVAVADPVDDLVSDYLAKRATKAIPSGMNLSEAIEFQDKYVRALSKTLGTPVGYKVGLVTEATQQRFGLSAPLRGVLLKEMLLPGGSKVPVSFGARPLFEADLIVVVKDEGINSARTPLQVAEHLSQFVAFIELPDSLIDADTPVDGPMLAAGNVGARLGVLGPNVPIRDAAAFARAMEEMSIVMTDQSGRELARAQGKIILEHPLNAVLWLVKDLSASGKKLRAGELLSLGSIAAPQTPEPGQTITVRYEGLPGGTLKTSVHFRR